MKSHEWKRYVSLAAFFGLLAVSIGHVEAAYPEKPITIIVPYPAGGLSDIQARTLANPLSEDLKQPVVVVNKAGAAGVIGSLELEKAKPDGYTIATYAISQVLTQYTSPNPTNMANIVPISHVLYGPATITINANQPWRDLKEFIKHAKANPNKIRSANSGNGGSAHIFAAAFEGEAGIKLIHVPFKGFAPAVAAIAGGHVEATSIPVGDVAAMVKAGKLRILAIAAEKRHYLFPEVPTMKELNVNLVIGSWQGFVAPRKTPLEIIRILDRSIEKALKRPEVVKTFRDQGYDVVYKNHSAFWKWLKAHDAYIRNLVDSFGLRVQTTKK
ncbi:MAG: Bug family tripartite tricarboxylate transporter substrate binding protein [Candidatus Binatia bacterium]